MAGLRIVVLEGDQTGQELLQQALRVIDPDVIALDVELDFAAAWRQRLGS